MAELPDVTLCCIDTVNHALAVRALSRSRAGMSFGRTVLMTHGIPSGLDIPADIELVDIGPLSSRDAYSGFVLKRMLPYVQTSHVLLVQWDGYVVNPAAWTSDFLACDYIGAKWFWCEDRMRVGNGGFSLRSRRLLQALQDPRIGTSEAEDTTIGRIARPLLEAEHGIRFADEGLADRFAFEAAYPVGMPFGFHGLFNFCRTVPVDELAVLAKGFSDAIARSPQLLQLMRNCAAMEQWRAAEAIASRILLALPDAAEPAVMLQRARAGLMTPNVGRNAPCPCGSGRKYKQCHGALGQAGSAPSFPQPPGDPEALIREAMAHHERGRLDLAEHAYRAVLEQVPDHPLAMHYLGVIHFQRNDLERAIPLLEAAARATPAEPEFHNNLGLALAAADDLERAVAAYERALALRPQHATAWNNLGLSLQAMNRVSDAIAAYRQALVHAPDFAQAHWNLALALLCRGDFREGWQEYEWRLSLAELGAGTESDRLRRWDGRPRPGATLLLTAEQGLGDALQFVRFARTASDMGLRVIVQAPTPLRKLLATTPGVSAVLGPDDPLPQYDVQLPLLSIAGVLRVDVDSLRTREPYVTPDPMQRAVIRTALASLPGRRIGICWKGNPHHANDRRRSVPYAALQPLLRRSDVSWVSLQMDSDAGAPLLEWPARNDFDALAALISELDLVVTVDTSVAHLAGALGKATWVLLPFAPDWRWQLERDDTPWYRRVRLFRQPRPGDWSAVVAAVNIALDRDHVRSW